MDYTNLSLLLFITQQAISELKNAKSKKIEGFKDMDINPVYLLMLLRNFDSNKKVGKYWLVDV